MSFSIDANLLLYASDESSPRHRAARTFVEEIPTRGDLLCLAWVTLMAYQRISTHPSIFAAPLSPGDAWENIHALVSLPRCRMVTEQSGFLNDYAEVCRHTPVRGNLVPDAHLATLLRQHGVSRLYTADTDFRKFPFLEVVNPLEA